VGVRIAPTLSDDAGEVEAARTSLAEAILSKATGTRRDVAALKANALYTMARHYR